MPSGIRPKYYDCTYSRFIQSKAALCPVSARPMKARQLPCEAAKVLVIGMEIVKQCEIAELSVARTRTTISIH